MFIEFFRNETNGTAYVRVFLKEPEDVTYVPIDTPLIQGGSSQIVMTLVDFAAQVTSSVNNTRIRDVEKACKASVGRRGNNSRNLRLLQDTDTGMTDNTEEEDENPIAFVEKLLQAYEVEDAAVTFAA